MRHALTKRQLMQWRHLSGLNISQAANALGLPRETLSRWESNPDKSPDVSQTITLLVKYITHFGILPDTPETAPASPPPPFGQAAVPHEEPPLSATEHFDFAAARDELTEIGKRLFALPDKMVVTQDWAASELRLPLATYRNYEYGKRAAPVELIERWKAFSAAKTSEWQAKFDQHEAMNAAIRARNAAAHAAEMARLGAERGVRDFKLSPGESLLPPGAPSSAELLEIVPDAPDISRFTKDYK